MIKYYIYKTINTVNGCYYIGKHASDNIESDDYLGSGVYLNNAIKKYGREKFIKEILFVFDNECDAYNK
jgi:hypothetical protein